MPQFQGEDADDVGNVQYLLVGVVALESGYHYCLPMIFEGSSSEVELRPLLP